MALKYTGRNAKSTQPRKDLASTQTRRDVILAGPRSYVTSIYAGRGATSTLTLDHYSSGDGLLVRAKPPPHSPYLELERQRPSQVLRLLMHPRLGFQGGCRRPRLRFVGQRFPPPPLNSADPVFLPMPILLKLQHRFLLRLHLHDFQRR